MTTKTTTVCDYCGAETVAPNDTPLKWFRLSIIKLLYRPTLKPERINDRHILEIPEEPDPHFCSLKCLMWWLEKQARELQTTKGPKRSWNEVIP